MNERQMIHGVLKGDPAAERAFFDTHVDRIFRLAYRMTGNEALAEDYTQETFIRAFDRLESFEQRSALSTWLHSIAVSVVLNGLRKVKRINQHEVDLAVIKTPAGAAKLGSVADLDLKRWLHAAIDQLPDDLRLVFIMHDVEGYKHREMAEILDVPVGTTKTRLARARQQLQQSLAGPQQGPIERNSHDRRQT